MLISLNWLKKYVDLSDVTVDELVGLIGARLVEVEGTEDLSEKYKGIKVVEVVSAEKIKGSDHLTLCQINTGAKDLVQVVCGAPNVKAGMLAAWLAPGVVLPETYNKEPLVLDKRKLMGVESAGMLAAMDELDLGTNHAGIVEINPNIAKPGDSFAKVFELDDIILDIENKSLTHRPDCFGVIGFAREVAGVLGQKFVEPEMFKKKVSSQKVNNTKLKVEIADSKLCPRYSAAVIDLGGVAHEVYEHYDRYFSVKDSYLSRSGVRPIDHIVDVTNYLMLLTGQPLHAFDYDKLIKVGGAKEAKIIVRAAKKGEELELLDGKVVKCDEKDILITSNNKPIALAGAMGGANTAIDENTKRIVIESATFSLFNIRGTQFRHGIFSEAVTRFTKGQPEGLTMPVLHEAINTLGGKVEAIKDCFPKPIKTKPIDVGIEKVNATLGTDYDFNDMVLTLENVGFKTKLKGDNLQITSPWWRTDIHIAEDAIEEIGRLKGYDNIALTLPTKKFEAPTPDKYASLKTKIRESLISMGANELLTYSFVSEDLLKKAGQDSKNSFKIINSISPELQYVRQSLTPSLLEKTYENIKNGYNHFALFEVNKLYQKKWGMTNENVPVERDKVGFVLTDNKIMGDAYYDARRYLEELFTVLGISCRLVPLFEDNASDTPFEKKRRAKIEESETGKCLGVIGEYKQSVLRAFKLPSSTAGFELIVDEINEFATSKKKRNYSTSKYQSVKRDVTFKVDVNLEFSKFGNLISSTLAKKLLWYECSPVSIWQGDDKKTKNISFNLSFASYDKTLKSDEIADIMDTIISEVKKRLKGELV